MPSEIRVKAGRRTDGRVRGMTAIGDALRAWAKQTRARERAAAAPDGRSVFDAWRRVVGEEVAARTRVVEWRGGELLVEVSSAPLLNELSTYFAAQILESLHEAEELRTVHRIRFRAGSF
jgi:hypothetical protein